MQTLKDGVLTLSGSVIAIGAFDGVHKGHQAVIKQAVEKSRVYQVPSVVYTFDPPPRNFFKGVQILSPIQEKVSRIAKLGVDYIIVASFDEWYATRPPEDFICELSKLNPVEISVGSDFHFGKNRAGDVNLLEKYFHINITSPVYCKGGKLISSTRIRQLIAEGDFQQSYSLLGM
ncbi:FAD synthetase family protein [Bacillus sp. ISL-7]|uniref:FAD synthetase family protein n=1 Tax=Bacillus sp. ISL-7 TaxID=2819136 RepID=UPI001BE5847E|nr:FAD synthetase family protein [Bacillus sp. ISL-7]MBT2737186.1 FAD synthetase family protein [Bacillus sp. ISL-7]